MRSILRTGANRVATQPRGFTILQLMVGLAIFSLGLLLLTSMMVVSMKGSSRAETATQSIQLMREKVEQIKQDPAGRLRSGNDMVGVYTRTWDVSRLNRSLSVLKVRVSWKDAQDESHACSTTTYVRH